MTDEVQPREPAEVEPALERERVRWLAIVAALTLLWGLAYLRYADRKHWHEYRVGFIEQRKQDAQRKATLVAENASLRVRRDGHVARRTELTRLLTEVESTREELFSSYGHNTYEASQEYYFLANVRERGWEAVRERRDHESSGYPSRAIVPILSMRIGESAAVEYRVPDAPVEGVHLVLPREPLELGARLALAFEALRLELMKANHGGMQVDALFVPRTHPEIAYASREEFFESLIDAGEAEPAPEEDSAR